VPQAASTLLSNGVYLFDSEVVVDGLRIYGAPWTPPFFQWAFMLGPTEIAAKWDLIPRGIDVLCTHGPPLGIGDSVPKVGRGYEHVGCPALRRAVERVNPRLHVFGHVHADHGHCAVGRTLFVNAASCDQRYQIANQPIVVEMEDRTGGFSRPPRVVNL
jgi:Icc-related predicted phosphoesterase